MDKKLTRYLCLGVSLNFLFGFTAYLLWVNSFYFTAFFLALMAIISFYNTWKKISNSFLEIEKIAHAILQKDFSLFPKLNQTNAKNVVYQLYYQAKQEQTQLASYKFLYENILNKQDIAFLILCSNTRNESWEIFYSNQALTNILETPNYAKWSFYAEKIPNFFKIIESTAYNDYQGSIEISIASKNKSTYSLRTKRIQTPEQCFFVISLESIQKIVDRKEKMAWHNLMKVISHELLNTLTPINSLIQNMSYLAQKPLIDLEEQKEMQHSLQIINSKSEQLLDFVTNYRQIAEIPKPKKENFNLKTTLEDTLKLFQIEFENHKIELITQLATIHFYGDAILLERVFINLITNSISAFEDCEIKKLSITLFQINNRTVIQFTDTGSGIDDEIIDKIFLPFFTTRKLGAGIGLTLAKSIVEAHNGYIICKRLPIGSTFEVWLT